MKQLSTHNPSMLLLRKLTFNLETISKTPKYDLKDHYILHGCLTNRVSFENAINSSSLPSLLLSPLITFLVITYLSRLRRGFSGSPCLSASVGINFLIRLPLTIIKTDVDSAFIYTID